MDVELKDFVEDVERLYEANGFKLVEPYHSDDVKEESQKALDIAVKAMKKIMEKLEVDLSSLVTHGKTAEGHAEYSFPQREEAKRLYFEFEKEALLFTSRAPRSLKQLWETTQPRFSVESIEAFRPWLLHTLANYKDHPTVQLNGRRAKLYRDHEELGRFSELSKSSVASFASSPDGLLIKSFESDIAGQKKAVESILKNALGPEDIPEDVKTDLESLGFELVGQRSEDGEAKEKNKKLTPQKIENCKVQLLKSVAEMKRKVEMKQQVQEKSEEYKQMREYENKYQQFKEELGVNAIDAALASQNRSMGQQSSQQGNWFEHITNLLIPHLLPLELSVDQSPSSSSSSSSSREEGGKKVYDPKRIKVLHRVTIGMGAAEFDFVIVYVRETEEEEEEERFEVPNVFEKNLFSSLNSASSNHRKMAHPLLTRLLEKTIKPYREQTRGTEKGRKLPEIQRHFHVEEVIAIIECKSNSRDISGSFSALQETLHWLSSPDNTGYDVSRWKNSLFRSGHFDGFGYHVEASSPLSLFRFDKASFSRFSSSSLIQQHFHYVTRKSLIDVPYSISLSVALHAVKQGDCETISEDQVQEVLEWCKSTFQNVHDSFHLSGTADRALVWQISPLFAFDFVIFCLLSDFHLKQSPA